MEIKKEWDRFTLVLPTASWYGPRSAGHLFKRRKFWFPKAWDIQLFEPPGLSGMRVLNGDEVRKRLREPVGTEPLRKLAETRRSAAIIVDDLTRPTPAFAVLPAILEELQAGGMREEDIRIVIGMGEHRPLKRFEQRRKVGREVADRFAVENHDAFAREMTRYARPNGGPDIRINRTVGEAELKVSISGIIPQGGAGFGGGAKAILPAVSSYETIQFNHQSYAWEGYGVVYPEQIQRPCIRKDMEEVARIVGLDFSVNLVFTPYKEITGLFCGDFVKAHRRGCALARESYLTPLPEGELDIVVANGYPLDTDIGQSHRGSWPEKYGRVGVLMGRGGDGWAYHGDGGKSYRVFQRMRKERQRVEAYKFKGTGGDDGESERYYFSEYLDEAVFYERNANRRLFGDWDALIGQLSVRYARATVGIFPYAALQLERSEFLE